MNNIAVVSLSFSDLRVRQLCGTCLLTSRSMTLIGEPAAEGLLKATLSGIGAVNAKSDSIFVLGMDALVSGKRRTAPVPKDSCCLLVGLLEPNVNRRSSKMALMKKY